MIHVDFPPLYAICDADVCQRAGWTLVDLASACLDGGARVLQIRAKHAPSGWFLNCTEAIVARAAQAGGARENAVHVIVNDRADIARLAGAGGVHVGQEDLSVSSVRAIVGGDAIVGLSTHTKDQVSAAVLEPIAYLAIGPVFGTATKDTGYETVGLDAVRNAAALAAVHDVPVVAIGGITLERAASVLDAGADAVAVITDLLATNDPEGRVRAYVHQLRGYNRRGEP